jgi:hypothetical protein
MKKTALLYITIIFTLLFSSTFIVGMVNSAPTYTIPTGPLTPPTISMVSPETTTYVSWFVPIEFSVTGVWDGYVDHIRVDYSIDEGARYSIYNSVLRAKEIEKDFAFSMGPLSEGMHHLQIFATVGGVYRTSTNSLASDDFTSESSVYFTVNTTGQAQISILSPLNQTYNMNKQIPVEFTVNRTSSIVSMGYTLDEQSNVTIPRNTTLYGPISDGFHTLKVYAVFNDVLPAYSTVNFTVDTTAPDVSLLSIQNHEVFNSSEVPLVFTTNETTSLITYILDGKVYTISGNKTLSILQDGNHELTVYATDAAGNARPSETVTFDVRVPIPPQLAYGILPPLVIVLVGGLSILIYRERLKQSKRISQ